MTTHVIINGQEVRNPVAKWLLIILGFIFAFAIASAVIFIILPLVGLTLTFSLALMLAIFLALLVVLPLLAALCVWLGLLSIPYHVTKGLFKRD